MTYHMGIDMGSAYSKGVITSDGEPLVWHVIPSGADYRASAGALRTELLRQAELTDDDVARIVATGTGADTAWFAGQKASEIVCTARGVNSVFAQARTVIDLAGQCTRAIRINREGMVTNFAVTEKCASGSGRFIEVIANVLRVDLSEFGPLAARSSAPVTFGTGCAVFGESEAITRISEGTSREDIAAGVNRALATKVSSLVKKVGLEEPAAVCGGGALSSALLTTIERELGIDLLVPRHPQIITALGAAVLAAVPAGPERVESEE